MNLLSHCNCLSIYSDMHCLDNILVGSSQWTMLSWLKIDWHLELCEWITLFTEVVKYFLQVGLYIDFLSSFLSLSLSDLNLAFLWHIFTCVTVQISLPQQLRCCRSLYHIEFYISSIYEIICFWSTWEFPVFI